MSVHLRVLGTLSVKQGGRALELPASRKVRALLAYLALAPRATSRHRLCGLLWDCAADPRGELRWALSKLRGVVGATHFVSRDDSIRLEQTNVFVDALEIQRAARTGIGSLAPARARELLALFGGEFLEGLQVDGCPEFTGWLVAQRRRFRAWRIALLKRIVESVGDDASRGDESFSYVEQWLELAPLDAHAHEHLLGALARRGRFSDGEEQLAASVRLFSAEGLDGGPLRTAWRTAQRIPHGRTSSAAEQSYDYYLQGRQHLARMMHRGLEASRQMFVRALELDAGYAPAWAGLATVHACLYEWFDPREVGLTHAEQASRRALEAAPRLAEAHVARGLARSLSRHYDEAANEFGEAIRINPDLFDAYYYFARTAFSRGDMARAAEMFGLAAQLRPEDFQSPLLLGTAARALGRESAACEAVQTGIRRAEQVLALNPQDGRALSLGAGALIDDGQTERALEWSRQCLDLYPHDTSALVNVACVHARVGQRDQALDLLERVFARGCGKRDWVANDPDYASLRNEPRFHRLLEQSQVSALPTLISTPSS